MTITEASRDVVELLRDVNATVLKTYKGNTKPALSQLFEEAADTIVSLREHIQQLEELGTGEANSLRLQLAEAREALGKAGWRDG